MCRPVLTKVMGAVLALTLLGGASSSGDVQALLTRGDYQEAVELARERLATLDGDTGASPEALARAIDELVGALIDTWRASDQDTISLAERAVALRRRSAPSGTALATSLVNLAHVLSDNGQFERSEPLFTEALANLGGASDPVFRARSLRFLAWSFVLQHRRDEAGRTLDDALKAAERGGAAGRIEAVRCLSTRGALLIVVGRPAEAEPLLRRAVTQGEALLGSEHPELGRYVFNLALALRRLGRTSEAEAAYQRALGIAERRLAADNPLTAGCHNGLALLAKERGDYVEARRQYEAALAVWAAGEGETSRNVAGILNNLGNVCKLLGELDAARRYQERALAIREKLSGPDHPDVAQSLTNLGAILLEEHRNTEAAAVFRRALAIRERTDGADNLQVAVVLTNLGSALLGVEDLTAAAPVLRRAVAVTETRLGGDHPDLAEPLYLLGLVELRQGNRDAGLAALGRARTLLESAYGSGHPDLAVIHEREARFLASEGRRAAATEEALEAERIGREHLRLMARGLSEREALQYATRRPSGLDVAASVIATSTEPTQPVLEALWDATIGSRGLVLDEMASRSRLFSARDPAVAALVTELRDAASELARLVTGGARRTSESAAVRARAQTRLEHAERALAEVSDTFRERRVKERAGLAEVRASLPADTALVGYLLYRYLDPERPFDDRPDWRYLALVLPSRSSPVAVVPLGSAAEIDGLITTWRSLAGTARSRISDVEAAGAALSRRIWSPIASRLGGAHTVLLVPDGSLHLVNPAALPVATGATLLEAGPLVHTLSEELDLVSPAPSSGSGRLLALGDPAYDALPAGERRPGVGTVLRGTTNRSGLASFSRLPATAREVALAADLWRHSGDIHGHRSRTLTGAAASEAAFRSLAPGAEVLHLATHGFFIAGGELAAEEGARGVGGLSPAARSTEPNAADPLAGSGLALAGANCSSDDRPAQDDGILSASEIATLDLRGLHWAVLSACDSGTGRVSAGEGVFGLQRAFRIAGARTLVMSLWAVDDEAAREWMEALYRNRLAGGQSTAEAVRLASLQVLRARRERGASTHPFYWAGFVAAGDWR